MSVTPDVTNMVHVLLARGKASGVTYPEYLYSMTASPENFCFLLNIRANVWLTE